MFNKISDTECIRKMQIQPKSNGNISSYTFPNGLRLIYEPPYTNMPITTIVAYCNVGSANETNELRGASHFIEHCIFKGTNKLSNIDIFTKYDNAGATLNAYTEKRFTKYFVKTVAEKTDVCIQILSDMLLHSTFPSSEFVKEEKVVIEENLQSVDDPSYTIDDMYNSLIYKGTSYEYPVDHISYHKRPFSRQMILDFYRQFYRPDQIIVSIVSTLSFKQIVKMVKQSPFSKKMVRFSYQHANVNNNVDKYIIRFLPPPIQSGILYKMSKTPNLETTHLTISFRTCSLFSNDVYIFKLLQHIMSGTFGSMLSILLREKNGLTYSSTSMIQHIETTGDFTIYVQLDKTKLLHNETDNKNRNLGVLPLIIGLLNDIVQDGIPKKTFETAKINMRGKMVLDSEKSTVQASHNGLEWLLYSKIDSVIPYQDLYKTYIEPITLKDVNDVIRHYFKKSAMFICLVGSSLPSMKSIERECEKFIP